MQDIRTLWLVSNGALGARTAAAAGSGPPLSLTLVLGLTCCSVGLIVGLLVLGFLISLRRQSSRDQPKENKVPHD